MQVTFVMFKADGTRRDFPLTKERIVIGRKNTCDLRIPLSSVSRQHCEVRISGDTVRIKDLGSSNGTYHNSIRVQESTLDPGDEVVIGPVVFTVVIDGKPERVEPGRSDVAVAAAAGATPADLDESPALAGVHGDDDENESPNTLVGHTDEDDDEDVLTIESPGKAAGAGPARPAKPVKVTDQDDNDPFADDVEAAGGDDDEDPIAALERLAEAERAQGGSNDSEFDFVIDIDDDEDDDNR